MKDIFGCRAVDHLQFLGRISERYYSLTTVVEADKGAALEQTCTLTVMSKKANISENVKN